MINRRFKKMISNETQLTTAFMLFFIYEGVLMKLIIKVINYL